MSVLFKIDQLPDISPKHMTGEQILERAKAEGTINEERFKNIDPKEKYVVSGIGVRCAVNHEKRLRSAFMNGSWQAVQIYLDQFIQKVKSDEKTNQQENNQNNNCNGTCEICVCKI